MTPRSTLHSALYKPKMPLKELHTGIQPVLITLLSRTLKLFSGVQKEEGISLRNPPF